MAAWEEQKDKYAKFADGTVRPFDGFERMESIEFTTENYLGDSLDPAEVRPMSLPHQIRRRTCIWLRVVGNERCPITCAQMLGESFAGSHSVFGNLNAERSLSHLINRPVYYREVPALVLEYTPQSGSVLLAAEQGHEFPPIRRDLPPTKAAKVDLLSELIRWHHDGN